jgi:hypothetical protein
MNNQGKVTGLKFSVYSGEDAEQKHYTRAQFDFQGNITVGEAKTLVTNFKEVVSEFEENTSMPLDGEETDTDTSSDEALGEPVHMQNPVANDNIIIRRDYPDEQKENEVPNTDYPVHGNAMSLNYIRHNQDVLQSAWDNHASVLIECSAPRNMYGHRLSYYKVVFPPAGGQFRQLACVTEDVPVVLQNHGYPVCSCPAYHFKSYKFWQGYNDPAITGMCKHVSEVLSSIGINASTINWQVRPDELPFVLKQEGVEEYQWVPNPPQPSVQHSS